MKTTITPPPWQPACWVGGILVTSNRVGENWLTTDAEPIINMPDDCRAKYAAVKATSAIMRAMRK